MHHKASHAVSNTTTWLGSFTAICIAVAVVQHGHLRSVFDSGRPGSPDRHAMEQTGTQWRGLPRACGLHPHLTMGIRTVDHRRLMVPASAGSSFARKPTWRQMELSKRQVA